MCATVARRHERTHASNHYHHHANLMGACKTITYKAAHFIVARVKACVRPCAHPQERDGGAVARNCRRALALDGLRHATRRATLVLTRDGDAAQTHHIRDDAFAGARIKTKPIRRRGRDGSRLHSEAGVPMCRRYNRGLETCERMLCTSWPSRFVWVRTLELYAHSANKQLCFRVVYTVLHDTAKRAVL